jgi:MoaD family protein
LCGRDELKVKVRYFAITRELVNMREEVVDLQEGSTAIGLLKSLATRHEKLREYVFDPKTGNPRPYLQFLVDDNLLSDLKGFETTLTEGCTFAIVPPVGGG